MNTQKLYLPALIITLVIIAMANAGNAIADAGSKKDEIKKKVNQEDSVVDFHYPPSIPVVISGKIQVYDSDFNLVYESIDIVDRKLYALVLKSDLIVEINNTHIYQLSR
jgi:hypothetical protein